MYALRFPIHHADTIRREAAKNGLDPAWVAAEIRAESVFNPNARSGANAMGLMQVVPATGLATARRIGVPWSGVQTLFDPDANIAIGSAYLRELYDKYGPPYMRPAIRSRCIAVTRARKPTRWPHRWKGSAPAVRACCRPTSRNSIGCRSWWRRPSGISAGSMRW